LSFLERGLDFFAGIYTHYFSFLVPTAPVSLSGARSTGFVFWRSRASSNCPRYHVPWLRVAAKLRLECPNP
jgi:hypothetical protein